MHVYGTGSALHASLHAYPTSHFNPPLAPGLLSGNLVCSQLLLFPEQEAQSELFENDMVSKDSLKLHHDYRLYNHLFTKMKSYPTQQQGSGSWVVHHIS